MGRKARHPTKRMKSVSVSLRPDQIALLSSMKGTNSALLQEAVDIAFEKTTFDANRTKCLICNIVSTKTEARWYAPRFGHTTYLGICEKCECDFEIGQN